jgi:hypothetical protein
MRKVWCIALLALLAVELPRDAAAAAGAPQTKATDKTKEPAAPATKTDGKESSAAELTRTRLLKLKVSCSSENIRLGDILKSFADQVEMQGEQHLMWAYGEGFPYDSKVTFSCKDRPLDVALDLLFKKAGGGLGYIVVSSEGEKYDGWVRLTTGGERGTARAAPPPATTEDEASASEKLALAKKLIDAGKRASAKPLLEILAKKYPGTKAGAEAKELLEKLDQ